MIFENYAFTLTYILDYARVETLGRLSTTKDGKLDITPCLRVMSCVRE